MDKNSKKSFFKISDGNLYLNIYVQPRASKPGLANLFDNHLKIKIKSPPIDGAANKELVKFFSALFKVAKSDIDIIFGVSSRRKIIKINNYDKKILKNIIKDLM